MRFGGKNQQISVCTLPRRGMNKKREVWGRVGGGGWGWVGTVEAFLIKWRVVRYFWNWMVAKIGLHMATL